MTLTAAQRDALEVLAGADYARLSRATASRRRVYESWTATVHSRVGRRLVASGYAEPTRPGSDSIKITPAGRQVIA